jgi:hypothetical protein
MRPCPLAGLQLIRIDKNLFADRVVEMRPRPLAGLQRKLGGLVLAAWLVAVGIALRLLAGLQINQKRRG